MKSVIIIGIIIAVIVIGGGVYYMNSLVSEVGVEEISEDIQQEPPEGKQYVVELSDSVAMAGT